MEVGNRRIRSDKKREVKPLVSAEIKEVIYQMSNVTQTPVKDVCEFLILFTLRDKSVYGELQPFFKRGVSYSGTFYAGDLGSLIVSKKITGLKGKLSIKLKQFHYDNLSLLAYALDCTPTRVAAILIEYAIKNVTAITDYINSNMMDNLSAGQINELKAIVSYVNSRNYNLMTIVENRNDVRQSFSMLRMIVDYFLNK